MFPYPPMSNGHGHGGAHNDLVDWIVRGFGWRIGSDFAHHLPIAVIAAMAVGALVVGVRRRMSSGSRSATATRRLR